MTTVRYIGAYSVPVTEAERQAALACHGDPEFVARELGSLALVELEVCGAPSNFDIAEFKQPHTEYVPYDESYFDLVSLEEIHHEPYKAPQATDFRVAFFLHFFVPDQPLLTPYGEVTVAPIAERPCHLAGKEYVFWD